VEKILLPPPSSSIHLIQIPEAKWGEEGFKRARKERFSAAQPQLAPTPPLQPIRLPAPMEVAAIGSQSPLSFPSSLWCVLPLRSFPLLPPVAPVPLPPGDFLPRTAGTRWPFLDAIHAVVCCSVL